MGKSTKRSITFILLFSLIIGLCGCFDYKLTDELKPDVIKYVQDKYGFEPQIKKWEYKTVMNRRSHYLTLSDGATDFLLFIDDTEKISDNYEASKIDEAARQWIDERIPGIYGAHISNGMYSSEEKFTGDVWDLFKKSNRSVSLSATYVGYSLNDENAIRDAMSELDDLGIDCSFVFLSCPSEYAAKTVSKRNITNDLTSVMEFAPYIDESLSSDSAGNLVHRTYELSSEATAISYCAVSENGDNPSISVEKTDASQSKICPTYRCVVENNDDKAVIWIYIPASGLNLNELNGSLKYMNKYENNNIGNYNLSCTSSPDDKPESAGSNFLRLCGDYVVAEIHDKNEFYFTIIKSNPPSLEVQQAKVK